MMAPDEIQRFRQALIIGLASNFPISTALSGFKLWAHQLSFEPTAKELEFNIAVLVEKGFAEVVKDSLCAASPRWKATAACIDYAEAHGLI